MVDLIDRVSRHTCSKCRGLTACVWGCQTYHDTRKNLKISIEEWLSSFDTSSATKCFEAVNILKMKIAQEEMHEADERLLNSDWGEMEVQE